MSIIINFTPHAIVLRPATGEDVTIPPSGTVARVAAPAGVLSDVGGIPVPVASPDGSGVVTDLPEAVGGTWLLVSGMVGAALKGRTDILVPGTGPADGAVRNERGHIIAVTRLKRV